MSGFEELRNRLDAGTWLAVGIVGIALFILGIYTPGLGRFPYSTVLEYAVAIAGGAVAVLGFSNWWDQRDAASHGRGPSRPLTGRAREMAIAPSLEVYRPPPVARRPELGPGDEDDGDG